MRPCRWSVTTWSSATFLPPVHGESISGSPSLRRSRSPDPARPPGIGGLRYGPSGHRLTLTNELSSVVGPVTTPARTVVDLARINPFEHAVVAADAALRVGLTNMSELRHAVNRAPRRPGIRKAHQVIAFADSHSDSAGESRSRVMFWREGFPMPQSPFPICALNGDAFARSDFGWAEHRTVGEFDGAQKYGRLLRPGERAGDRIHQEKLREDRIRDAGYQVVRWTWEELQHPEIIIDRLHRAFDRASR